MHGHQADLWLAFCRCIVDHMNNNVAACGFYFDPTDYNRQSVTNMEGRHDIAFMSCRYVYYQVCSQAA